MLYVGVYVSNELVEMNSYFQVQQPIITQGATVTKITFGSHQPATISKPASGEAAAKLSPVSSTSPAPSSEKSSVSDILKISMLEAQIDPSVEPMVVDSSSDCTFSKGAAASQIVASGQLISSTASPVVQSSQSKQLQQSLGGAGTSLHGQFTRIQNLPAQKSKEVDIIQVNEQLLQSVLGEQRCTTVTIPQAAPYMGWG